MADSRVDEVADGIYRISTCLPHGIADRDLTVNQFLVLADEPLLFHTGLRSSFPETSAAVARVLPLDRLRWLSFGHVEADECGAMNQYLAASPQLEVAFGALGCRVSVDDLADRLPRRPGPGRGRLDLGGRRVVVVPTPHAPAQRRGPGAVRGDDRHAAVRRPVRPAGRRAGRDHDSLVEAALEAEACWQRLAGRAVPATLEHLAELEPPHAGGHARLVVRGRRRRGRCVSWPAWRGG